MELFVMYLLDYYNEIELIDLGGKPYASQWGT